MHTQVTSFGESLYWGRLFLEPENPDGSYTQDQLSLMADRYAKAIWGPYGDKAGSLRSAESPELRDRLQRTILAVSPANPASVFQAIAEVFMDLEGRSPFAIEKTPHHINWIERIRQAYPNARFIASAREPYSFMRSYKHQGDRQNPEVRDLFHRLYHPIGCAIVWRGYIRSILAAEAQNGLAVLRVDFSRMKEDEEAVLREVQAHFGLPIEAIWDRVEADNTSFPTGKRPELSNTDIFWMNLIAGREIKKAGYIRRKCGLPILGILRSILRIPVWTIAVIKHIPKITGGSPIRYLKRWFK